MEKYKSTKVQKYKSLGIMLFYSFTLALFYPVSEAQAFPGENCEQDWHPPPCGKPPEPVKSWVQQQLENLEQYHFSASQVAGVAVAAACVGSTGDPRVDQVRKIICAMGKGIGGFAIGMQVWEARLISELNAARDGGTQEVVMMPAVASFEFVETDDAWLNALQYDLEDHRNTVEWLGELLVDSVHHTFLCDAWAQYDVDGIRCGNDYRAFTDQLFSYLGQRSSAVSAIEGVFLSILEPDAEAVGEDFIGFVNYDRIVNGWEGWNLQQ